MGSWHTSRTSNVQHRTFNVELVRWPMLGFVDQKTTPSRFAIHHSLLKRGVGDVSGRRGLNGECLVANGTGRTASHD